MTTKKTPITSLAAAILLIPSVPTHCQQPAKTSTSGRSVINLVLLGATGHGKTTLLSAITKVLSQSGMGVFHPYEALRTSSRMKLGSVEVKVAQVGFKTARREYRVSDFAISSDLAKGMLAGGVDFSGAVLVVAGADGPLPETRDAIRLAAALRIQIIGVFINKVDAVQDVELLELVELETKELLQRYNISPSGIPFIRGSALGALEGKAKWEAGVEQLIDELDKYPFSPARLNSISGARLKTCVYAYSKDEEGQTLLFGEDHSLQIDFAQAHVRGFFIQPKATVGSTKEGEKVMVPPIKAIKPGDQVCLELQLRTPVKVQERSQFVIRQARKIVGIGAVVQY